MCALVPRAMLDAVFVIVVIHTLNVYSLVRLRFPGACYAGWGTGAMYLGYLSYAGLLDGMQLVNHASVLVLANLFGMIAAYQIDMYFVTHPRLS